MTFRSECAPEKRAAGGGRSSPVWRGRRASQISDGETFAQWCLSMSPVCYALTIWYCSGSRLLPGGRHVCRVGEPSFTCVAQVGHFEPLVPEECVCRSCGVWWYANLRFHR